jgi:hypothetical protein
MTRSMESRQCSVRDLQREMQAAKIMREQIATLANSDEDFIRDVIEGETDLHEIVSALVEDDAADAALVNGINEVTERLAIRRARLEERIAYRRALIVSGLQIAGLTKLETPVGTATVRPTSPRVIVTDESLIPSAFWKSTDPKLDKRALAAALKGMQEVAGATLSNGGTTLEIRRS